MAFWVPASYQSLSPATARQDIAIIRLSSPLSLSSSIGLVSLASTTLCSTCQNGGTPLIVSGYGNTQTGNPSDSLLYVAQVAVAQATCDAKRNANGLDIVLGDFCAGPVGTAVTDSCQGDSGGMIEEGRSNHLCSDFVFFCFMQVRLW